MWVSPTDASRQTHPKEHVCGNVAKTRFVDSLFSAGLTHAFVPGVSEAWLDSSQVDIVKASANAGCASTVVTGLNTTYHIPTGERATGPRPPCFLHRL